MNYRQLGDTGIKVSEIGFGAWAIGGGFVLSGRGMGYGTTDDKESEQALHRAIDLGVNFIDTANSYGAGRSEELIGKVLQERSEEVYTATKAGVQRRDPEWPTMNFSSGHIREEVEKSLKRLKREVIDVYQLHNPSAEIIKKGEAFSTLKDLQREGKIRFFGASIGSEEEGFEAMAQGAQVLQVSFNMANRKPEEKIFPAALEKGIGIIIREPLANGILTGKFTYDTVFPEDDWRSAWLNGENLKHAVDTVKALESAAGNAAASTAELALRFVLSNKAVSVVIPGAKNPKQAEQNCGASVGSPLSPSILQKIDEIFPPKENKWSEWGR